MRKDGEQGRPSRVLSASERWERGMNFVPSMTLGTRSMTVLANS